MTNKKTEHTTEDGTTFKVGDTVVQVDHVGNPYVETVAVIDGFTKTLMKVTQSNGDNISYRLDVTSKSMNIKDIRVLTDSYRDILRVALEESMIYETFYLAVSRLLSKAYTSMFNHPEGNYIKAPDPVEAYKLLKEAQAKLNETIARIEEEVFGD